MSLSPLRHLVLSSLFAATIASAGCGAAGDVGYAEEALDSTESASTEGALLVPATDGTTPQMAPAEAATNAVARASTFFQPAGCVTATPNGATVTYVFHDCTGPHGLVHVTGTVVVTFSAGGDGLHVHTTSTGLQVNAATINVDSDAVYTVDGATRKAVVTTRSTGTGPRGNSFTHQGSYTVTWGAGCLALDGNWSTRAGGLTWSTSVTGFSRCAEQCPAAGATITHTGGLSGVTITVTTDGSGSAKWSSSRGRSGTVEVNCK